ncbi:MAG: OB-fold nucleic acid binding domain-containing protein [Nanoarchaeota archaeon]
MEERKVKILAAVILIAGLIALSYIIWAGGSEGKSSQKDPQSSDRQPDHKAEVSSKRVNSGSVEDGSRITITGKVTQVIDRGKVSFLKLSPASRYQLVSFDKIEVEEGSEVKISGKVQTYKGKKEIIIDKISAVG